MSCSTPTNDGGLLAHKRGASLGQTHGDDVLLESNVLGQTNHREVVLKRGRLVIRMDLFPLDFKVFVGEFLALFPDIPLAKANTKLAGARGVNTMGSRQDPPGIGPVNE